MSQINSVRKLIKNECLSVMQMLLKKNERYGNSALDPIRVFSRSDLYEQIRVRIDDKLKRIQNQAADDDEDAEMDLIGYLILLRVARKQDGAKR
jgi:hypothetical protein